MSVANAQDLNAARSCAKCFAFPQDDMTYMIRKNGYVYFMSNKKGGVIYIGVTSALIQRVYQHKMEMVEGFTKKYKAKNLVYYEIYDDIETAIANEKKLKHIHRCKKIEIIEKSNPEWKDLYNELL